MSDFVVLCALAFVAALLAASGSGHTVGLARFAALLRGHGLLPAPLALPAAIAVTGAELAVAAVAAAALAAGDPPRAAGALAAALLAGAGFLLYLRRLLRSGHTGSCGCSPLAAPLTPASFAPAAGLAAAGGLGLAALASAGRAAPFSASSWEALAAGWGLALVALVLLLPATAPARAAEVAR